MPSINSLRRRLLQAAATSAVASVPWPALTAELWPAKTVRMVVPFPPGGGADAVARLLSQELSPRLGQSMFVDNRPGGNMVIGASEAARAAPDGYTLLLALDSLFTVNPYVYPKLPYDPASSFAPVSLATTQAQWYVARPGLGVRSMDDLLKMARQRPGRVNYGYGSPSGQLTAELLRSLTGAQLNMVAYKGGSGATLALLADEVDVIGLDLPALIPHLNAGKMVPLGQSGIRRSPLFPQVPTMQEQGIKGFEALAWFGIYAPARTPDPIVQRLNQEMVAVLAKPEVQDQILKLGYEASSSSPQALAERSRTDAGRWERLIRANNLKLG